MQSRKEMKKNARKVLRKHYWLFVVLCLLAAVFGTEFTSSLTVENSNTSSAGTNTNLILSGMPKITDKFHDIVYELASGNDAEGQEIANQVTQEDIEKTKKNPNMMLGRSRGVFSMLVNGVTSGSFFASLAVALTSIVGSGSLAVMILIIGGLLLLSAVWIFGTNLYQAIMRRMFLEGRCYDKIPLQRSLFFLKVRRWFRASLTLFVTAIYQILWMLTIVGGFIKVYSYYLVPYIVAENPELNSKEAITLSRKMMNGHKWECFVFELSFLLWDILGLLTLGITNIFFANPYKIAYFSEYYVELRRIGKERQIKGTELLKDTYLFEKAGSEILTDAYGDIAAETGKQAVMLTGLKGIHKFLAETFGLTIKNSKEEKAFEEDQAERIRLVYDTEAYEGLSYPTRLSPIPVKQKRMWLENIHYIRNYSIWSMIMLFFIMSFIGWVWEVSLHLVSDGVFVNRGVMHGPWLPIYGSGSVLMLIVLYKFRRFPAIEFLTTTALCGGIEYISSYILEITHHGKKWWDYSGYFLNLNGRICAEGLLTFGLGGMMIIYVLAPLLDNIIRRIPMKKLIAACFLLIFLFTADQIYSQKHPNEGKGITDYTQAAAVQFNRNDFLYRYRNI